MITFRSWVIFFSKFHGNGANTVVSFYVLINILDPLKMYSMRDLVINVFNLESPKND